MEGASGRVQRESKLCVITSKNQEIDRKNNRFSNFSRDHGTTFLSTNKLSYNPSHTLYLLHLHNAHAIPISPPGTPLLDSFKIPTHPLRPPSGRALLAILDADVF